MCKGGELKLCIKRKIIRSEYLNKATKPEVLTCVLNCVVIVVVQVERECRTLSPFFLLCASFSRLPSLEEDWNWKIIKKSCFSSLTHSFCLAVLLYKKKRVICTHEVKVFHR